MRFVPINCVKEGMRLGYDIYSDKGIVLLSKNVPLKGEYINSIKKIGINGVYVDDSISNNIEIKNVISEELRINAVAAIKKTYNNPNSLIKSIASIEHLSKNIIKEISRNKDILINMIDIKTYENYLYSHCVNVAVLSTVIGIAMNIDRIKLERLTTSALLHDIGLVFIDKDLVNKIGGLSKEELEIVKNHSEKGYKYIKDHYSVSVTSYIGILQHHEQYDGKGYPEGKSGEDISLFGRIICLCNIYDYLISSRPHKGGFLPSEAIEYIMGNNGQIFDPKIVKVFLKKVSPYPLGTIVKLSNEKEAIVIENNESISIRPKVRDIKTDEIYDLSYDWNLRNVTIVGVEKL